MKRPGGEHPADVADQDVVRSRAARAARRARPPRVHAGPRPRPHAVDPGGPTRVPPIPILLWTCNALTPEIACLDELAPSTQLTRRRYADRALPPD